MAPLKKKHIWYTVFSLLIIMKSEPMCAPCLLNRVLFEAELSTKDKTLVFKAIQGGVEYLNKNFCASSTGTDISTGIHRVAYRILQDPDPYRELKAQSNAIASKMMPAVRKHISEAPTGDRFRLAVLASIIGNNFDFGLQDHDVTIAGFEKLFESEMKRGLDVDDTRAIF